jgi:hypothetical protein
MQTDPFAERLYQEQYHRALARQHPSMFEDEDVSPLLLGGMLIAGMVLLLLGTWFFYQRLPLALEQGFATEITVKASAVLPWKTHVPAHLLLLLPTTLYLLASIVFGGYRRYARTQVVLPGSTQRLMRPSEDRTLPYRHSP